MEGDSRNPRVSLLKKYDLPIDHLTYEYIEKCTDKKELERIIRILRSGEEGMYPDLVSFAEKHLQVLAPDSRVLRVETPVLTKDSLISDEWKKVENDLLCWENDMKVMDKSLEFEKQRFESIGNNNLPEVRKAATVESKPKAQEVKKVKIETNLANEKIRSGDYAKWDKFDVDKELLKIDVEEERQAEENKKKKKEMLKEKKEEAKIEIADTDSYSSMEQQVLATQAKDRGNECFKAGDLNNALKYYGISIKLYASANAYNNRAMTYLKLKKYEDALADCNQVLQLEPNNVKALHRRSTAYQNILSSKNNELALADLLKMIRLEPNNKVAQADLQALKKKLNIEDVGRKYRMPIMDMVDSFSGRSPQEKKSCWNLDNLTHVDKLPLTYYGPSTSTFQCEPQSMTHRMLSGPTLSGRVICKCNSSNPRQNPLCQRCGEKQSRPKPVLKQIKPQIKPQVSVKTGNDAKNRMLKIESTPEESKTEKSKIKLNEKNEKSKAQIDEKSKIRVDEINERSKLIIKGIDAEDDFIYSKFEGRRGVVITEITDDPIVTNGNDKCLSNNEVKPLQDETKGAIIDNKIMDDEIMQSEIKIEEEITKEKEADSVVFDEKQDENDDKKCEEETKTLNEAAVEKESVTINNEIIEAEANEAANNKLIDTNKIEIIKNESNAKKDCADPGTESNSTKIRSDLCDIENQCLPGTSSQTGSKTESKRSKNRKRKRKERRENREFRIGHSDPLKITQANKYIQPTSTEPKNKSEAGTEPQQEIKIDMNCQFKSFVPNRKCVSADSGVLKSNCSTHLTDSNVLGFENQNKAEATWHGENTEGNKENILECQKSTDNTRSGFVQQNAEVIESAFEFIKKWEALKKTDESYARRAEVMRLIRPGDLSKVIGNKLDSDMLKCMLECLEKHFIETDPKTVVEFLQQLPKVPRFGIVSLFLDGAEKKIIERLVETAERKGYQMEQETKTALTI